MTSISKFPIAVFADQISIPFDLDGAKHHFVSNSKRCAMHADREKLAVSATRLSEKLSVWARM